MDMQLVEYSPHNDEAITCPYCKWDYTHHHRVTVWSRQKEDAVAEATVHLGFDKPDPEGIWDDEAEKSILPEPLPEVGDAPGRRDSVEIDFYCENCQKHSLLSIVQHKGQTLLYWGRLV